MAEQRWLGRRLGRTEYMAAPRARPRRASGRTGVGTGRAGQLTRARA